MIKYVDFELSIFAINLDIVSFSKVLTGTQPGTPHFLICPVFLNFERSIS